MTAPFGGGADAHFRVRVDADADAAAKKLSDAFSKAIADAMKSKTVQTAIADVVKQMSKAGEGFKKSTDSAFKDATKQGQKFADTLVKQFERVREAAQKAFDFGAARGAHPTVQTLNAGVVSLMSNLDHLSTVSRRTMQAIEQAMLNARQAAAISSREARNATTIDAQTARERIAILQKESTQIRAQGEIRRASISAFGQITLQVMRSTQRAISAAFRGGSAIVRGFTRSAGSAFRGMQQSAQTAFRGMQRVAEGAFRAMSRLFSTFGRGLTSALHGVSRAFAAAFRRDEQALQSSLSRREAAMRGSQSRMAGLLSGGLLGGLAGGAGIASLLTSGFERFGEQERLQLTFEALLRDGPKATAILTDISDFARTTSFDFVEVAGSVAQFTATLGDVDEAFDMTRFLADITALTGGTTESLGRVRLAMTQIASAGRLDAANLKQLTESLPGVPFAQILADKFFGGDVAAYSAARDAGELGATITAEAFFDAFQQGVEERFPEVEGFAQTAATTVSGLAQNLKENFAIFGATLIGLGEGPIKGFIGWMNQALDVMGQFVTGTGEIFGLGAGGGGQNPFTGTPFTQMIPFEDLTPEMQEALREGFGWEEGQGRFLSAQDAERLWDQLNPPDETVSGLEGIQEHLTEIRDLLGDMAKSVAGVLGLGAAFKVIRIIIAGLISPFALIVAGAAALGFVWNRITNSSVIFRNAISGLSARLGLLKDAFGDLLGTGFRMLSNAIFGNPDFWKNIGDSLAEVVGWLSRGIGHFTEWLHWADEMIAAGDIGLVWDSIVEHATMALDALEDIPIIGPIVGFARRVAATVSEAFRDVWDAVFGGDVTDQEGPGQMFRNMEAEAGGDRGVAGRLRAFLDTTFLAPVVDFFANLGGAAVTIGGYITGFFSDIWSSWTNAGGGDTAGPGGTGAVGITPAPAAIETSLTQSFLDPILHFFRDTLPTAASTIGGYITGFWNTLFGQGIGAGGGTGAVGITPPPGFGEGFLRPLVDAFIDFPATLEAEGWGEAVAGIWTGLVESAGNIWDGGDTGGGGIKGALDTLWENIKTFFGDLDWGAAISGAAIAGAIGLAFAGVPGLLVGIIAGGAAGGAGLLDPIINAIGAGWDKVYIALEDLWNRIAGWFRDKFTVDNLVAYGVDFLGFVNGIGTKIGEFFSSDAFTIALVAATSLVGAVTAVLLAFGEGLVVGLSGAFLDWADRIAPFFEDALIAAAGAANFIPGADAVIEAIAEALGTSLGAAGLVTLGVLGPKIVAAIFAGVTGLPAALGFGAAGLISLLFGRRNIRQIGVDLGRHPFLKGFGAKMAGGIALGFADFEFSRAAGRRGGVGNLFLSLLAGGTTGAAFGLAIGGPIGAAIGGALGVATSALGFFFGGMEADARSAREEVNRLAEELKGLHGAELTQSIEDQLRAALTTAAPDEGAMADWGQLMISNFDFQGFADDLSAGLGDADLELVGVVENIQDQLATQLAERGGLPPDTAAQVMDALVEQMRIAAEEGDFTSVTDLIFKAFSQLPAELQQVLGPTDLLAVIQGALGDGAEVTIGDLQHILDVATNTGEALRSAFEINNVAQAVSGIDSVSEAVDRINQEIEGGSTAEAIADILGQSELTSAESLQAVADVAGDVEDALNEARDALVNFITGGTDQPPTKQVILAQFTLDAANMQEQADQLAEETNTAVANATQTLDFQDFQDSLNGTIRAAVDAGLITDPASFTSWKEDLIAQVEAIFTDDDDTKTQMLAAIEGLQMPTADLFTDLQIAEITQAKVDEIASIVERGLTQALGSVEVDFDAMRAVVVTGAGAGGTTGGGGTRPGFNLGGVDLGESYIADIVTGIGNKKSDIGTAVSEDVAPQGRTGIAAAAGEIQSAGAGFVKSLAKGITSAAGTAAGAARSIAITVADAFYTGYGDAYSAGRFLAEGFRQGILSKVSEIRQAAVNLVQGAIRAAQNALGIASPSKVFANIGREVGRGFIAGLKDTEGDMTDAIATALENAIERGVERAAQAVARSQVAARLFEVLQPSILPGGISNAARLADTLDMRQAVLGFRGSLTSGASSALGDIGNPALAQAQVAASTIRSTFAAALGEIVTTFNEAKGQQQAITDYNQKLFDIGKAFHSGALGQQAYNEALAEMRLQVKTGELSAESYADRLKLLDKQLKLGVLNLEAYEQAIADLGERPAALTAEQQQILRTGTRTLDPTSVAGAANREAIIASLEAIRNWGQEALAAGRPLSEVISSMVQYRQGLVSQLQAYGFNNAAVQSLIASLGLSDAALKAFRNEITSLNQATQEGAANAANLLDQFVSIREFGQRMLESGVPLADVIAQMKAFRDQIVAQAVAFGFNRKQVEALIKTVGLDNAALKDFIKQLAAFAEEAKNAEAAAKDAAEAARKKREEEERKKREEEAKKDFDPLNAPVAQPGVRDVHVHLPFGDPEAVALGVANKLAYDQVTSW